MKTYKNTRSGIVAFEIDLGCIWVYFRGGFKYKYSDTVCGSKVIDHMIALAVIGKGLNTFISNNKPSFDVKVGGKFPSTNKGEP